MPAPGLTIIWSDVYRVAAYEVGPDSNLRLPDLFSWVQQSAWRHAEHLGFGFKSMSEQGLAWVLFQVDARIHRLPAWDEEVILETWPSGIRRFIYDRDLQLKDHEGNALVDVITSWMLIDLENRHPRQHPLMEEYHSLFPDRRAVSEVTPRIRIPGQGEEVLKYEVGYSALDPNRHMNTSRYISCFVDALPEPWQSGHSSRVVANFLQEVHPGETTVWYRGKSQDKVLVWARDEESGRDVFAGFFVPRSCSLP